MPVKALYVDDEPDTEILIRQKFRKQIKEGIFEFVFAKDGVEAIEILKMDKDIEIVLSDINMPRMDGLTLLLKLKELDLLIETVIISAYGDMKNIRTAMNRGAYDFLTKPIDIEDFEITLNRTIEYVRRMKSDVEEKNKLRIEIERSQKEMIYKLGELVEVRSRETGNHVRRVSGYSGILSLGYGFNQIEAEEVELAASMHDIGKVGIPDAILNKPGKLTVEEFEIMKTHSVIGYELLKDSKRKVMQRASIIAYQHHEKYNGKGYPQALKKENIHVYGRITAIADVFDALGSNRVYKKAWEMDRALEFMKEQRGEHFDPGLIDIFFNKLDDFLVIHDKYKD